MALMQLWRPKVVNYYYYPGFHEPGSGFSLGINKRVWESLDSGNRQLIEASAACEYTRSLAEFNANNALSLHKLRQEGSVKIQKFNDSVLKALREISREVTAEMVRRRDYEEDLRELPAVPQFDHGLERYLRARRPEQPGCLRIMLAQCR
jgi:TRAP-type mannitol/chloroaromatic compound transport system substrate-binding protein